jgi:ketosteroid isomerase-like protein
MKAGSILAADNFTAITRSNGMEEVIDVLLNKIANPKEPNIQREIDDHDFQVWSSGDLGIVRSLVATRDRHIPNDSRIPFSNIPLTKVSNRFRNTHVFEKQQGRWRCIAWQVTELE